MTAGFVRPFLQWLRRKHSANVEFQRNHSWEWGNPCFVKFRIKKSTALRRSICDRIRTVERSSGPFDPLRPASGLPKTAGAFHSDKLKNRPPYGDRFFNRCDWIRTSGLCVPNNTPADTCNITRNNTVSDFPNETGIFQVCG